MFPSISRALPNTSQVTQFVASRHMTISTQSLIAFAVNSVPDSNSSITVNAGDLVSATVLSPLDYFQHEFFTYTIDGIPQNFAVVNVSQFTITLAPAHANRRWYDYSSNTTQLTLRGTNGSLINLQLYKRFILVDFNLHFVIDASSKSVYLINTQGGIAASFVFPDVPINYQILKNLNLALVVTAAGELYSIDQSGIVTLLPTLPNGTPICLSYDGTQYVWVAGGTWAWKLDATNNFSLLGSTNITDKGLGIAALPDGSAAIVATDTSNLYLVDLVGVTDLLHTGVGLGQPTYFNNKIYIPDSSNSQLLVYNYTTGTFDAPITTAGFSPSYTFVDSNTLYVCGNDSSDVLVFDQTLTLTSTVLFFNKVTWISVVAGTIVSSYWLSNYTLTLAPLLQRIVNIKFNKKYGPITHIGSDVVAIKQLGAPVVTGYTSSGTTLWVNGTKSSSQSVRGVDLVDDDNINISYRSTFAGTSQVACVIGDTAYDYQITSFVETYIPRYIDFPIGTTVNPIYTLTIPMPTNMTPCTMAIEYGTLYLDGLLYDGSYYVRGGSEITISIPVGRSRNFGLGTLPIFTLGGRQFAVPISVYVNATNTVIAIDQLAPGTLIKKTQIISGQASLYDFILPDYYDVDILKNNISVAGGYYQVFSVGDELSVVFSSSNKLYDTVVVYILGPTNYKFIADNSPPFLIDQLLTTPVVYPYTRAIDPVLESYAAIGLAGSTTYVSVSNHAPTVQYQTPTYTITTSTVSNTGSLQFIAVSQNYLHYSNSLYQPYGDFTLECWAYPYTLSGDSFLFVLGISTIGQMGVYLDGGIPTLFVYDTQTNLTSQTPLATTAATGTLSQNIWHHIAISRANSDIYFLIDGRIAATLVFADPIGSGDLYISDGSQVVLAGVTPRGFDGLLTDIRYVHGVAVYTQGFTPTARPLTSTQLAGVNGVGSNAISSLTSTILLLGAHTAGTAMVDSSSFSNSEVDSSLPSFSNLSPYIVDTSVGAILTVNGGDANLVLDGNIAIGANITLTAPNGKTQVLENAVHVYLGNTISVTRNVQSYYDGNITVVQNLLDTEGNFAEFVIADWGIVNQVVGDVDNANQGTVILDTLANPMQSNDNIFNSDKNIGIPYLSSTTLDKSLVEFNFENLLTPASSTHEWYQETVMVPASSTHEWYQETVMIPGSSTHEWHQETVMIPASSTHEWHQEITLTHPSSTHEWHQETAMTPASSTHEWHQETVMASPSSSNEWHQEIMLTHPSSTNEWHQEITLLHSTSSVQFDWDTLLTPKSSLIGFDRERYTLHETSEIGFDREHYTLHETSEIGFDRERYTLHEANPVGFDRGHYTLHETSEIGFDREHYTLHETSEIGVFRDKYSLTKTAPPTKEIYKISFDKLFKNRDTYSYSIIKTPAPEKSTLLFRFPKKEDWAKLTLAKSLIIPTIKLKFTEIAPLEKTMPPRKSLDNFNYPSKLSYVLYVLSKDQPEPIDYRSFVLSKESPEPIGYATFVLSADKPEPIDYRSFVLSKETVEPMLYTIFTMSAEKPEPMDYTKFAGDRYTIVPALYNKSERPAERLLLAEIERDSVKNYEFMQMPYETIGYNLINQISVYDKTQAMVFHEIKTIIDTGSDTIGVVVYADYEKSAATRDGFIYADYQQAPNDSGGQVVPDYVHDTAGIGRNVFLEYKQDLSIPLVSAKGVYEQDLSLPLVSAKGVFEKDKSLPLVSAKGIYEAGLSLPFVSDKITYEQNLGIVWNQDIDTDATAFVTGADADAEATIDGYQFHKPYKIFDTKYYSYRVLVDTALVCKLPVGRYPIAWLLHGG